MLCVGTKSEMLKLEKAYIDGEYTPFESSKLLLIISTVLIIKI